MLIHLDTSVLVDAFTGPRHSLASVVSATKAGDVLTFCALVQYEWLRGARSQNEEESVRRLFSDDAIVPLGAREAQTAAALYRQVKRARQRQSDLAIAACAIEHNARLWTLNESDFADVPGLNLYQRK